jgi:uncharacterized membrane protein YccC
MLYSERISISLFFCLGIACAITPMLMLPVINSVFPLLIVAALYGGVAMLISSDGQPLRPRLVAFFIGVVIGFSLAITSFERLHPHAY